MWQVCEVEVVHAVGTECLLEGYRCWRLSCQPQTAVMPRCYMRLLPAGNIEDLGEEIQTYHYRIRP